LFFLNSRDDLQAANQLPNGCKKKAYYIIKPTPTTAITEKFETELIVGELTNPILEHFNTILEEIYTPILSNQKNVDTWPEVVSIDVKRHFQKLNGYVYVVNGQSKGKTLLPLPQQNSLSENEKAIFHIVESSVIEWTHQIKDVLKKNSSSILDEGKNPGPMVELEFWSTRYYNRN
jgi:dynein heavy chain